MVSTIISVLEHLRSVRIVAEVLIETIAPKGADYVEMRDNLLWAERCIENLLYQLPELERLRYIKRVLMDRQSNLRYIIGTSGLNDCTKYREAFDSISFNLGELEKRLQEIA
jgi:hypothetical protein